MNISSFIEGSRIYQDCVPCLHHDIGELLHGLHDVRGSSFFISCGKGWRPFFWGGGEGGSHGFQGERREDQSSPTECKGKSMKKLTANTLPMGGGENIAEP